MTRREMQLELASRYTREFSREARRLNRLAAEMDRARHPRRLSPLAARYRDARVPARQTPTVRGR